MIVVTRNSAYEFDSEKGLYRKIQPDQGQWKFYQGFILDPCVGKSLRIIRDENTLTITSKVLEIHEDEDE